jgi:hypothetical protein
VLELYTQLEVAAFERMNKLLIENGILIPYSESAPEIDKTNVINARDLKALSKASPDVLREKLSVITSVQVLEKLLETAFTGLYRMQVAYDLVVSETDHILYTDKVTNEVKEFEVIFSPAKHGFTGAVIIFLQEQK